MIITLEYRLHLDCKETFFDTNNFGETNEKGTFVLW